MERAQAMEYAANHFLESGCDMDEVAIVKLRHHCSALPEVGINGLKQDDCEWALIDMNEKVDTCEYGCIYYFGELKQNERNSAERYKEFVVTIESAFGKIADELYSACASIRELKQK